MMRQANYIEKETNNISKGKIREFPKGKSLTKSTYVEANGKATIICPKCSALKIATFGNQGKRIHKVKIKCTCSHVFRLNVEYRQHYRKPSSIVGMLKLDSADSLPQQVKIKDISFGGVCFETYEKWPMMVDQHGCMVFTLNDKKKTRISKRFHIRSVRKSQFGCVFEDERAYEKDLGFYLRQQ